MQLYIIKIYYFYLFKFNIFSGFCYKSISKCYLLELKKKNFTICLENIRKEEYNKELKFYHSISIFNDFSRNAIERLKLNITEKKYSSGEIVITQGQLINSLYIVKSGSFQVLYKLEKNIKNEFDLNYYSNITPDNFRFTEDRRHEIKGFKNTKVNLKLLTIESGQFLGDLEFIHKKDTSYFTIVCLNEGAVLISLPKNVN